MPSDVPPETPRTRVRPHMRHVRADLVQSPEVRPRRAFGAMPMFVSAASNPIDRHRQPLHG